MASICPTDWKYKNPASQESGLKINSMLVCLDPMQTDRAKALHKLVLALSHISCYSIWNSSGCNFSFASCITS